MSERPYTSVWADLRGVTFTQGWLDADGIRTRYISSGDPSKPLLLLLHGVGGHAEAYARNFGAHGEHFWTVAIDMIGHGWTDQPDIRYQLPDYERHVLGVLKALGRESAMISGESLGGWVATWLAVHQPQVVEKMVLNTAGGWTAHPEVMARIKKLSNEAASDPTWQRIRTRLEFLMCDKATVTDDLIETRRAIYSQPGFAASMARIMGMQEMDIRRANMISEAQYRAIKTPTLVVWTSHDPTATPAEGAEIAEMIEGSKFIVMNECGHWPQYEDAELFNRVHIDFLLGRDISATPASGPEPVAGAANPVALEHDVDVMIVGAGPVGLLLGNILGAKGLRVLIAEALPELIDYPRGVGIDDESLRAFQAAGLVEQVLPHTTPHHAMRFVNGHGRTFASIEPKTDEFGWPRRNAFIQPLVDRVSADGLARFPAVELRTGCHVDSFVQDDTDVTVTLADGSAVRCRYLVGSDGGRSPTREALGIAFEGKTDANRWIVVDIADDPMGLPNAYMHADPARPYASIALPHGIRRLEFMLFPGEGENGEVPRDVLNGMLARVLPDPTRINLIRARVYTHNGRLAARFRQGRVLLAGDAAHIMPVWQGQGFNSGIRDAFNLGWKLGLVAKGVCSTTLLDSYEAERKAHAKAMIALSQTAGAILAVRSPVKVWARDAFTRVMNSLPPVKRYFLEMRFKPMPRYREGALHYGPGGFDAASPVGRIFIQPRVALADGWQGRLDDVLGNGFALISWGVNPSRWIDPATAATLRALDTKLVWVVPMTGLTHEAERHPDVTVVGDLQERLKPWFGETPNSMVLLRPDRFVAINCSPQRLDGQVATLAAKMGLTAPVERQMQVPVVAVTA